MTTDVATRINQQLALFFTNGKAEVGLEVGADPGLSPSEYIVIPKSMEKKWQYTIMDSKGTETSADGKTSVSGNSDKQRVLVHDNMYFVETVATGDRVRTSSIKTEPFTFDDVRRFILANTGHIRDSDFDVATQTWIHATRFWSVVAGLVTGTKQTEYTVTTDSFVDLDSVSEMAQGVVDFCGQGLTACAARATSWRKSNHATGGEIASGFPRRWLAKNEFWTNTGDKQTQAAANKRSTSAFYVATHASCVHNILAMMAGADTAHWAKLDPKFGIQTDWDTRESASIRMTPTTQVAGVAMVVDAVVCMRMLVSEGISPMLENTGQIAALATAYKTVVENGIRTATYASWFLDGHPNNLKKVDFSQKSPVFAELVGELGAAATSYYRSSTIGQSPSLANAASQMCPETAKSTWAQLGRIKSQTSNHNLVRAFGRIKGTMSASTIQGIVSSDRSQVTKGVEAYNSNLRAAAVAFNVANPPVVSEDLILANSEAADSQATALTSAAK